MGPHDPFDPPAEYAERYRAADVPEAVHDQLEGKPGWVKRRQINATPKDIAVSRRQYCGAIELIDDQIGLILDAVSKRGMLDKTYVVFSSDHGEMLGDHGLYTKSLPYEPSLRIPLIVSGPGIRGGRTTDAMTELIDLNPTLCELAGLPHQENIDARSFVSVLRGKQRDHRPETVSAIRNWRCIRDRRFKLIQNDNDITELYDLEQDPHELENIASQSPALVRDLTAGLRARFLEAKWLR